MKIKRNEEYYQLIGSSKYVLLPYDEDFYKNRTSGVMIEGVFVNSIPIANASIMDFVRLRELRMRIFKNLPSRTLSM